MKKSGWLSEGVYLLRPNFHKKIGGVAYLAISLIFLAAIGETSAQTTSSINLAAGQLSPTNTSPVNFTIVFGEKMNPNTFTASDIVVTGSSANATAAPPTTPDSIIWNVSVFATSPGTITAFLPAGVVTSFTLNTNLASSTSGNTVIFDNVAPTVTINQAATQLDPGNANPVNFTAVFSRIIDPLTFTPSDITLGGTASAGAFVSGLTTIDNVSWNLAVSGISTTGTITASLAANKVKDLVGNNNKASTSTDNSVFFSVGAPSVVINQLGGQPDPAASLPLKFSVVFSQAIDPTTFSPGDLTISGTASGATAANLTTADNITWTVDIVGVTSSGTVIVTMAAGKVKNPSAIDNIPSVSTDNSVLYNFPGSLTVTVEQDGAQADPATAAPVFFIITFSEAINPSTFTSSDITVTGTASGATASTPVSSNNAVWTVPVTGMTASGTIILSIGAGLIQDFGVPAKSNAASTSLDNSVTYNDLVAPSITTLSPSNGDLSFPASGDIVITFNKLTKSYDRKLTVYRFSDHSPIVLDLAAANPSVSTSFTFPTVVGATPLLTANERYYILIPPGDLTVGFANTSDVPFAGIATIPAYHIADNTNWIFKTADSKGPVIENNFIDFVDPSLMGGNLQLAINKISTVYFLLANAGDPVPTQDQIIDPFNVGSPYGATPTSFGNYFVSQAFQDNFIPVDASLIASNLYVLYVTAVDAGNNRMGYDGAGIVGPVYLSKTFTAADPPAGPFDPVIAYYPRGYKICLGNFQPLSYPITIIERNPNDFSDGNISIALPAGFEFNTSLTNVVFVSGAGSAITANIQYKTSSIIRVNVSNTDPLIREKLMLKGLQIVARNTAASGPIIRLGGRMLPTIDDFASMGTLVRYSTPVVKYKAIFQGVDNTLLADDITSVLLLSDSTVSGQNVFTGDGVNGFNLNPFFAKIGSHPVTLAYTDAKGCISSSTRTIRVYNHAKAINGLDTIYCTNNIKVRINSINYDGTSALNVLSVQLITPNALVSSALAVSSLTFSGGSYYFDPTVMIAAGELAKQNGNLPVEGGTLAQLKFTGQYINSLSQADSYDQVVTINVPPTTGIGFSTPNLVQGAKTFYCEDIPVVSIDGSPRPSDGFSLGSFKVNNQSFVGVNGYVDKGNGTGKVTPSLMDISTRYASQRVRYTFKSLLTGCQNFIDSTLYVAPKPVADFTFGAARCVGLPVDLNGLYSFNPLVPPFLTDNVSFVWKFNDPQGSSASNVSNLQNTQHTYSSANNVIPSVTVFSKHGCASDSVSKTFQIGAIPVPAFAFSGLAGIGSDHLTFTNSSTLFSAPSSNSTIDYIRWNFKDNTTPQKITSAFATPLNHTFPQTGVYSVSLLAHSDFGCADSIRQNVVVLGKSVASDDNFEGPSNWLTYSSNGNTSWQVGQVLTNKSELFVDPLINGTKVWVTSASGSYLPNENSALYSPVYDLTIYNKPVVSFDNFTNIATSDGVVLQYSLDNKNVADLTKVWTTLGLYDPINPSGVGWYDALTLPSYPGGIIGNPAAYAWTGIDSTAWFQSKHSLDPIRTFNKVVFRFALGSVTSNPATDGFAMDNFRVGERNRTVLVENFTSTNVHSATEKTRVKTVADKITSVVQSGNSVVAINYHVDYNSEDPFNKDSPADPSSRALFYSSTAVPYTYVDGHTDLLHRDFDVWGDARIQYRLLDAPKLSINLVNVHNTDSGTIKIDRIDVQATGFIDHGVLMIAVVENSINPSNPKLDNKYLLSGETNFNYVLKKFLPSASGISLNALNPGALVTFKNFFWRPDPNRLYTNNFKVIAFVQNSLTREVYQVQVSAPMGITNSHAITGLEPEGTDWSIYPNPVSRELHMQRKTGSGQDVTVRLINQVGEVIVESIISKEELSHVINAESMAAGLYILQWGEGEGAVRRKVIVVH